MNKEGTSMADKESVETSEAQIAVHWQEEGYYYPSTKFIAQATLSRKDFKPHPDG